MILEFIGVDNISELKKAIKENNKKAVDFLEVAKKLFEASLNEEKIDTIKGKESLLIF